MFTGIVTDIGEIAAAEGDSAKLRRYRISSGYAPDTIPLGASIACAGICLTVIERGETPDARWFDVQAAAETLARTLAGTWGPGTRLNLERSLRVGDELGGHLVTGHVDGVAEVIARVDVTDATWGGETARFDIRLPGEIARFVATKGSIAVDGVSLTVNEAAGDRFSVLVIPHTLAVTTLGALRAGARVHVEVDLMARYAARLAGARLSGY